MTAPLTPAEVEQFAKLSAELDGGDITFYPTADDVAIVKRALRALTAAPIEKCIYCDLPSSKCLCAPDPRKRITAIPSKPYWLIERGQADGHTPTLWLREANAWKSGEPYLGMWTESAIEATRFETSSGAEYHIYKHSLHLCHVTEHLDLDAALTAAPIDGAAVHKDGGKTIFQPGVYPAAELEDAISRAVTDPAHETFIGGHAENPDGIGFVMRESAAPTVAPGDGQKPARRFACFTMEDGVYEHAEGSHVEYRDYAAVVRDLDAARREIAEARKPLKVWFDAQEWHSKTLALPQLVASVLHCVEQADDLVAAANDDAERAIQRANLAESRLESATQPLAPEMERLNKRVIELNGENAALRIEQHVYRQEREDTVAELRAQLASAEGDAKRWPVSMNVGRMGYMAPAGDMQLQIHMQGDGDIIVHVSENDHGYRYASCEFCACGSGGGRSPRTRLALIALMVAIEDDNTERPNVAYPQPRALAADKPQEDAQ